MSTFDTFLVRVFGGGAAGGVGREFHPIWLQHLTLLTVTNRINDNKLYRERSRCGIQQNVDLEPISTNTDTDMNNTSSRLAMKSEILEFNCKTFSGFHALVVQNCFL